VAIRFLGQVKATASSSTVDASVRRYPLRPLLRVRIYRTPWHWIFVNAAGGSQTVGIESNSFTVRGFCMAAWLLFLPGGIGVFEATALVLQQRFSPGLLVRPVPFSQHSR